MVMILKFFYDSGFDLTSTVARFNVSQLTDNSHDDTKPQIDGQRLVWEGFIGGDPAILYFDDKITHK